MDSDVVDSNSGVAHKNDSSNWGKRGDHTLDSLQSVKAQQIFFSLNNTDCYLLLSNELLILVLFRMQKYDTNHTLQNRTTELHLIY